MPSIKCVIFDFGNVLVEWKPLQVIGSIFNELDSETSQKKFYEKIRPTWIKLNLGTIELEEAIDELNNYYNISKDKIGQLIEALMIHQLPIEDSIVILKKLNIAGILLYAITDNTKYIVQYHKTNSEFTKFFIDIICSANEKCMKSDQGDLKGTLIFERFLNKVNLDPKECIFIDDYKPNLINANLVGINTIHFVNPALCTLELKNFGIPIF